MQYLVNLIYDSEYGGYVADVPALPGCMSQGKTVEKALENVKEAIRAYRKAEGSRRQKTQPEVITTQVAV